MLRKNDVMSIILLLTTSFVSHSFFLKQCNNNIDSHKRHDELTNTKSYTCMPAHNENTVIRLQVTPFEIAHRLVYLFHFRTTSHTLNVSTIYLMYPIYDQCVINIRYDNK